MNWLIKCYFNIFTDLNRLEAMSLQRAINRNGWWQLNLALFECELLANVLSLEKQVLSFGGIYGLGDSVKLLGIDRYLFLLVGGHLWWSNYERGSVYATPF